MKQTMALLLGTLLVSACGVSSASSVHSPAASAAAPATASGGPLSCRLPVAGFVAGAPKGQPDSSVGADGLPNQKGTGGFLDLPSGKFTPAPRSDKSYLAAAGIWVPVSLDAVSPDQRSYVQGRTRQISNEAPTTSLYLVQVATRSERLLFTPASGQMAFVLAFTAKGIYAATGSSTGPGPIDLLLIDPATGARQQVPGGQPPAGAIQQVFTTISGDYAWGLLVTGAQSQTSFELVRLSLADGSVTDWYDAPGPFVVVGFDSLGHPLVGLVLSSLSAPNLFLISAAKHAIAIQPKGGAYVVGGGSSVTDPHGTWFGSSDGSIWLYSPSTGLTKVATVPPQPGGDGNPGRTIAGPCL